MQKVVKILVCLLVALIFGAGASATLRAALEPPEIRNWQRTGELRFDHPVSEDYARRINEEVRALRIKARPLSSTGTDAIPAKASGSFRVVELKPSSLTLATCSHRSTGGLSIDTLPLGSKAPKKKLCQERPMLRTAAS